MPSDSAVFWPLWGKDSPSVRFLRALKWMNWAKIAAITTFIGAVFITISTPLLSDHIRQRLFDPRLIYIFILIPILAVVLLGLLLRSLQLKEENTPMVWTVLLFMLSFIGLGLLIFPDIIPPSVTIYQAAAAPSSLVFMLTFVGFLIPILLAYTVYNYIVFRGKITAESYGE